MQRKQHTMHHPQKAQPAGKAERAVAKNDGANVPKGGAQREEGYDRVDWALLTAIVFLSAVILLLLAPMLPGLFSLLPGWYLAIVSVHEWPWWVWLTAGFTMLGVSIWLRIRQGY